MTLPIAPGFDPRWIDVPSYAGESSREIWESRNIAAVADLLAPDLILRTPDKILQGPNEILADLLAERAALPDLQMLGESVIWCDTLPAEADGVPGILTSCRLTALATHRGNGLYGAASGAALRYRVMADFWCAGDLIRDGWLTRDTGALYRQLGLDARSGARARIADEGGPERCRPPLTPDTDPEGPYAGRGPASAMAGQLADMIKRLMGGEMSVIAAQYDRACELSYPGGAAAIGHGAAETFWFGLRSAFPSASFRIDHRIGRADPGTAPCAALRWSLYGKHDGFGAFGAPSGAYVYVTGTTHAEFCRGGLRREWTLIDEAAIWKQILLGTGDL